MVTLHLERGATAPVRVLDANGRPLAGARVTVGPAGALHPAFWDTLCDTATDASGLAKVDRVVLGRAYEIGIRPPRDRGQELMYYSDGAWVAGATEIRLEAGVMTSGVVHDADGRPVERAVVWWWEGDDPEPGTDVTDESGRFRFGPTKFGTLHLTARGRTSDPNGHQRPDEANRTSAEAGSQNVVLVLE